MRRFITPVIGAFLAVAMLAAPAAAMEPAGEPATARFGCVDGTDSAVAGHPGAPGLVDAVARVAARTGDPTPTAWNAVEHAAPIELGGC